MRERNKHGHEGANGVQRGGEAFFGKEELLDQTRQHRFYDGRDKKYENKIGRGATGEIVVFCFRHGCPRRGN
jgi:hypothetical protein